MYIFSQDKGTISVIIENTSSGDVLVNDTILHVAGIFYYGYGISQEASFINFACFRFFSLFFFCCIKCYNFIRYCAVRACTKTILYSI